MLKKLVSVFIIFLSMVNIALAETNIKNCKVTCVVVRYITPNKEVEFINVNSLEKALLTIENSCFIDSLKNEKFDKLNELSCRTNSAILDLKTNMIFNGVSLMNYIHLKSND